MLYDLNIAWAPSTPASDLERMLAFSASLGYNVVALNHLITPPLPSQILNPLPKLDPAPSDSQAKSATSSLPTVLRRATVVLDEPSQNYRLAALAGAYDLIAVRPTTDKAFHAACLTMSEISLISLDLTSRFDFHFRPKPCMTAVTRGVRFEICYGQALAAADTRGRANFISNVMSLVRATKGRGIVISSEARNALGLRAPADVVNLMAVWGLGTERGTEALGLNPRGVVVNEGLRRSSFRGVVNIIEVAGRPEDRKKEEDAEKRLEAQANKGDKGGGNQKRKTPDGAEGAPEPPISKRQAKKLRLAQKEAASKAGAAPKGESAAA